MPTSSATCPRCLGKKHVKVDGAWQPCSCLEQRRVYRELQRAGVEHELMLSVFFDIPEEFSKLYTRLITSENPLCVLCGGEAFQRWLIAVYYLRDASFKRKSIASYRLTDFIQSYFDADGMVVRSKVLRAQVAWLRMDYLRPHTWRDSVLEEILSERKLKKTIVTLPKKVPLIETGDIICL